MGRPSKIDRLPEEVREEIGRLRRSGRTIDEILDHLRGMISEDQRPSRTALGNHVQRIEVLGERIRRSREMSNALIDRMDSGQEDKTLRLNIELMQDAITTLIADEDGRPITLDPKQAKFLTSALRDLAAAKKTDAELTIKVREEAEKKTKVAAARVVETFAGEKGLSRNTVEAIKAGILGVKVGP